MATVIKIEEVARYNVTPEDTSPQIDVVRATIGNTPYAVCYGPEGQYQVVKNPTQSKVHSLYVKHEPQFAIQAAHWKPLKGFGHIIDLGNRTIAILEASQESKLKKACFSVASGIGFAYRATTAVMGCVKNGVVSTAKRNPRKMLAGMALVCGFIGYYYGFNPFAATSQGIPSSSDPWAAWRNRNQQ